jgi:hypothetical protein
MDVICSPDRATSLDNKTLRTFSDAEIRKLYYCKCYLQVKRISDLCTADGTFILPSVVKGERSIRQCASRLTEARQECPNEATWQIWKIFLSALCEDTNTGKNNACAIGRKHIQEIGKRRRLKHPLGNWQILA